MVTTDLADIIFKHDLYIPVFPQWNPSLTSPPMDPDSKDGIIYEISADSELTVGDKVFKLKKHDLLVKINGQWELSPIIDRNKIKFENWLKDQNIKIVSLEFIDGKYTNQSLQNKWVIWQAALNSTISG